MYKKYFLLIFISCIFFSCTTDNRLTLLNPLDSERIDEVIIISREEFTEFAPMKKDKFPVFSFEGLLIPSQVDDLDNDGEWDEITLVLDFNKKEEKRLEIDYLTPSQYPKFSKRTNLRLGILQEDRSFHEVDNYFAPRCDDGFEVIAQAEGVSWENDKMGFRIYFDCRNVKDLFGKLKPEMIIDKAGTAEFGDYHTLSDWGMDILHCGSSLGAGGLALLYNDSLIRLGSTDVYEYNKIIEGGLRSVFELKYEGWDIGAGEKIEAIERISIYPGKYWFESDVTLTGAPEGSKLATGIVTTFLENHPFELDIAGYHCLGTHDVQSLNNDELGMAILVHESEFTGSNTTSNKNYFELGYKTVEEKNFSNIISETCYLSQEFSNGKPAKHYFFAVWGLERDDWKTSEGFQKYIKSEAERISEKIKIY